ncbi:hypothetical protein AAC387_Pa05g3392 [Persea americana]
MEAWVRVRRAAIPNATQPTSLSAPLLSTHPIVLKMHQTPSMFWFTPLLCQLSPDPLTTRCLLSLSLPADPPRSFPLLAHRPVPLPPSLPSHLNFSIHSPSSPHFHPTLSLSSACSPSLSPCSPITLFPCPCLAPNPSRTFSLCSPTALFPSQCLAPSPSPTVSPSPSGNTSKGGGGGR